MMKSVVYHKFGEPTEELAVEETKIPEVQAGEVLIKTTYSVIHNHNLSTVKGVYGFKPTLPYIDGSEGAGIVEKIGEGVTNVKVGQRVAVARSLTGTWAQYFKAEAHGLVPLPDAVSDESGAQITSMPLSAYLLLDKLGVKEGDWFAYNGANGLVGIVLASIAKAKGVRMLKIVRRAAAKEQLEKLGFEDIAVDDSNGWVENAKKVLGDNKLKAAVDNVGGEDGTKLFNLLGPEGKFVIFGSLTGKPLEFGPGGFIFDNKTVEGYWVTRSVKETPLETIIAHQTEIIKLVATKKLVFPVGGVYSFDEIKKAAEASTSAKDGKILLKA